MRTNKLQDLTTEELEKILLESNSISDFLRKVGYSERTGGGYKILHLECKRRKIDIKLFKEYFKEEGSNRPSKRGIPIEEILVQNSNYQNRSSLKKRLIREKKLEYKCYECGGNDVWNSKKLSLQLNHKNGINNDNRIENLEFICPNCHSQTDNYAGKNK